MGPLETNFTSNRPKEQEGRGNGRRGREGAHDCSAVLCKDGKVDFCVLLSQRQGRGKGWCDLRKESGLAGKM